MTMKNKLLALDLGDRWVGTAITDASLTVARPYKTVSTEELDGFLTKTIQDEHIKTVIIGHPVTMAGGESAQTFKILAQKEAIEKKFPELQFVLWDERLSSQRASAINPGHSREEKVRSHSLAAAFILDSYLTYLFSKEKKSKFFLTTMSKIPYVA